VVLILLGLVVGVGGRLAGSRMTARERTPRERECYRFLEREGTDGPAKLSDLGLDYNLEK